MFENAGYHTVGMHPYYANGWGRSTVYPMLGFDEIYFLEDLDWGETVRRYVSDRAYVNQVIRLFEENAASGPLFLFGVTDIRAFALPLMAGVISGTYSSICLASALWFDMKKHEKK